jgi:hypothetical protein
MKKSLQSLVDTLGGSQSAARFLSIGHSTLTGYLDGSKKSISKAVWHNKIEELLNKSNRDLLTQFSKELAKLRPLESKMWEKEAEIIYLKQKASDDKYAFTKSPFNIYFSEFIQFNETYSYPLLEDIKKIKNNEKISIASLAIHMDEFKRLYNLFRPYSISSDHPYWGTVKVMDAIFHTLSGVFGSELDSQFTKWGPTIVETISRNQPITYKIDWERLENDAIYVSQSIDRAITELALESNDYFREFHSHYYSSIVKIYLTQRFPSYNLPTISREDIEPGRISLGGETIEFTNHYQLEYQIYENFKSNN